jgi:hypothetical protein
MLFGVLVSFAGIAIIRGERHALNRRIDCDIVATVRTLLYAGGFGLIMIGIAGVQFGMWASARPTSRSPAWWVTPS